MASTPPRAAAPATGDVESVVAPEAPVDGGGDATADRTPAPASSDTRVTAAGESELEALYRERYDDMVRVAFLLVGDVGVAEEAVQDAFVRVHLRWARVDDPGAYLRTCVVNACRDRLRRRRRYRERLPKLQHDALARAEVPATGAAAELHDVLLRLPLRQRTAIVGRYVAGWDDRTIAALLGCRPATVRSLVHRGLAALRTEIPR